MKKLSKIAAFSLLAASLSATQTVHADAVNFAVGSHGIALEYYLMMSKRVSARFALTDMPVTYTRKEDDADITLKYDRTNIGMLFDFRPMAGSFYLSTGLYVGDHNINLKAKVKDDASEAYDIGDKSYHGRNLGLKSQVSFAKAQPYLGLGWGTLPTKSGFSVNFDIGVLYLGKTSIDVNATGQAQQVGDPNNPWVDVTSDALFQAELEKERRDLEDDAKKLRFAPVIQLGMGYKF